MGCFKKILARQWSDEHGITSVEYAVLLAMIGGGLIMGATLLSGAVSNEMNEAARWYDNDGCGNDGDGDGTGGDGGPGQGGDNTC